MTVATGEVHRRFPAWVIPALASVNGFLLLFALLLWVGQQPVTTRETPPISNASPPLRNVPPTGANEAQSQRIESQAGMLTTEEIYRICAPATVSIVGDEASAQHLGSGFFVSADGYLLTNHHVVESARRIHVIAKDGTRRKARIIDSWPTMDLALLKVQVADQKPIPLANSDAVQIGSSVVAIGTPQDLELAQSITEGIVSGRRLVAGIPCYQTSALINHGNSGGPLLNMQGEAIGIATFVMGTALVTPRGNIGSDIQGINFAVEINLAKDLLRQNGVVFE